jgi:hypothetical protein
MSSPDRFLPQADEAVSEHVVVAAEPAQVYEAIGRTRLAPGRLTGMLSGSETAPPATLDTLLAAGFGPVELASEPGVRRVIGVAGRYGLLERGIARLGPGEFEGFNEPGSLKAVVELALTPQGAGHTLLGCDVRIRATDEDTRSTVQAIWFAAGAGLRLGVRRFLGAVKAEAERSGMQDAENGDPDSDHDDSGDLHPA